MQNVTDSPVAALRTVVLDRLEWAKRYADALYNGLGDEQLVARAGGVGNHPMWILGHLANTDDFFLEAVAGQPRQLPEKFKTLFGGGSEPTEDRSTYPSRKEVEEAVRSSRARLVKWVGSLDEKTAFSPLPEKLQPFAPDMISVPFTIVAHDCFHLGQVASVRASLGLPRAYG